MLVYSIKFGDWHWNHQTTELKSHHHVSCIRYMHAYIPYGTCIWYVHRYIHVHTCIHTHTPEASLSSVIVQAKYQICQTIKEVWSDRLSDQRMRREPKGLTCVCLDMISDQFCVWLEHNERSWQLHIYCLSNADIYMYMYCTLLWLIAMATINFRYVEIGEVTSLGY